MMCIHFIPSTSILYPEHGISYQVAKFYTPRNQFHTHLIFHSSHCRSHCMYIHLQLKQLVIFSDAPYDQIMFLSLHPPPRDGCDWQRLYPHARHRTHFHRVVKHDHVKYPCCMPELTILGHTQVLVCAPRLRGDIR